MKIVLVGYMGSGKSTVGVLLAQQLELPFIDLDAFIEAQEGMKISELFERKGVVYFRKLERTALEALKRSSDSFVLATGGGAPCYGDNMTLINEFANGVVYLKLSIPNLIERLSVEKEKRPLIAHLSKEQMEEFVRKHLFERSYYYNMAAVVIDTSGKTPLEVSTAIQKDMLL